MAPRIPRRDLIKAAAAAPALTFTLTQRAEVAPTLPATPAARPADLILKRGKIITVDRAFTIAEAIAIAGERILAVGREPEMAPHFAPWTRVIDLNGLSVIPGRIDGHAHLDREGLKRAFPALGRVRSIRDIQDRIAELAAKARPGEWIVTMPIGDPPYYFDVPDILAEHGGPRVTILTPPRLTTRSISAPYGDSGGTAFRWCPARTARRCAAPASREIPFHL